MKRNQSQVNTNIKKKEKSKKRSRKNINNSVIKNLHSNGYIHIKNAVNVTDKDISFYIEKSKWSARIFNDNEFSPDDKLRKQRRINTENPTCKHFKDMTKLLQKKFPLHNFNEAVIIKSLAGCGRQAAHCDYVESHDIVTCPDNMIPLGVLGSIEKGSKIVVWPKSHMLMYGLNNDLENDNKIEFKEINLLPGDILVFRGDLVHAGAAYEKDNMRVHIYGDSPNVKRDPNSTWIAYNKLKNSLTFPDS